MTLGKLGRLTPEELGRLTPEELAALALNETGYPDRLAALEEEIEGLKKQIKTKDEDIQGLNAVINNILNNIDEIKSTTLNTENIKYLNSESAKYGTAVYYYLLKTPLRNGQRYLLPKEEINFLRNRFPELKRSKNIHQRKDRINEAITFMFPDTEFKPEPLKDYKKGIKRLRKILKIKDSKINR